MRKYSIKIHRERLTKMLEKGNVCARCPAARHYDGGNSCSEMWRIWTTLGRLSGTYPCKVCMNFVGLKYKEGKGCPCTILGEEEALKRTIKALRKEHERGR